MCERGFPLSQHAFQSRFIFAASCTCMILRPHVCWDQVAQPAPVQNMHRKSHFAKRSTVGCVNNDRFYPDITLVLITTCTASIARKTKINKLL